MAETWTLDGLALHNTTFLIRGEGVDMTPPRQKPEWIGAADSEYQVLVRDPMYENRTIEIPMLIAPQTTKDLAFDKIGQIRDKLAKASKYENGIVLAWTSHGSARTINFDVLAGEITDLPLDFHLGFQNRPRLAITLTCKPFWYGTETLSSTTSSSTPFVTAEIANTIGDIPALGRLIITDTATQSRRHVEWGLEGPLTYNSGTSLLIDSDSMVVSGFAGALSTVTGSYDPNAAGTNALSATVYTSPTAIAGTGVLSHIGTFRVKARVQAGIISGITSQIRLVWKAGDGPWTANAWVTSSQGSNYGEIDLGSITVPAVLSGTQAWQGRLEGRADIGSATVVVDYLTLVPTSSGYGKARAVYTRTAGVIAGFDAFTSTTSGNALNARVATSGGTWATSGVATDYTFTDFLLGVAREAVSRSTASEASARFAILGSTNYTDVEVDAGVFRDSAVTLGQGVIARWTDSSNYLRGTIEHAAGAQTLTLTQRVAAADTVLASITLTGNPVLTGQFYTLRLIAFASGRALLFLLNEAKTTVLASIETSTSVLATAGTLATGKPGLYDFNAGASAIRAYDDVIVSTPAPEPVVIYSGESMQIRHDDTIREDSTGTYYGRPQSYRGSRFLVPVGTSRVLVKARRNDIEAAPDANVTDATQIQIGVTPRGLAVPRS